MLIASIDVGITHLALVFARLQQVNAELELVQLECVDSTVFEHGRVAVDDCTLGHTKTTADRIAHVVQERRHLFDACTHVLIERQPLQGHTHVEQVLYLLLRDKAQLVSPNAMHKFFNIAHYTYEGRKQQVVRIVDDMLPLCDFPAYHALERKHDVADALCLLLYWTNTQVKPGTRYQHTTPAVGAVYDEQAHLEAVTAFTALTNKFKCQFKQHAPAGASPHARPAAVGRDRTVA